MTTRRDFLKTGGALVVSFGAQALLPRAVTAAPGGAFATQPSHIDGGALDAWLAVGPMVGSPLAPASVTSARASSPRRCSSSPRSSTCRSRG